MLLGETKPLPVLKKKKVVISVINDLVTDQRVARTCDVFHELGYHVLLIGREQKNSLPLPQKPYVCERMKLIVEQGPLFYILYNLRLFFLLLFTNADVLFANDLDTLWPNYLVSKIKGSTLMYDSHEIFCEVPELRLRPVKKRIWQYLESWIVPNVNNAITVNQSIATYFTEKYKVPFQVVRNIPDYSSLRVMKTRAELQLPIDKKIIILQGAGINMQRGAEELVEAFQFLSDRFMLLIIGSGDVLPQLKQQVKALQLRPKVTFMDKIPATELRQYTMNSDLGISIDKDTNLNYHFSLPNKLFDYIHAGIPILATRLPEIEYIINQYDIGVFIDHHDPKHIALQIEGFMTSENYLRCKANTIKASVENNWQTEKEKLIRLIRHIDT